MGDERVIMEIGEVKVKPLPFITSTRQGCICIKRVTTTSQARHNGFEGGEAEYEVVQRNKVHLNFCDHAPSSCYHAHFDHSHESNTTDFACMCDKGHGDCIPQEPSTLTEYFL